MPLVLRSSLEHRIIEHASEHYPLTVTDLARALGVTVDRVMMELRRMESKGLVELDILPDKVFVRLLVVPARPDGSAGKSEEGRGPAKKGKKEGKGGDDPAYL
jgi:DNA-binding transcriptional ArsR family regulator